MTISQVLSSTTPVQIGGTSRPAAAVAAAKTVLTSAPGKDTPDKILKGAADFEALLIDQMLRSAREAGGGGLTGDDDDDSEANSSLLELGEQQFAQALSTSGGLGIGKMIVAGLNHANR
jgi:Rod binding domain-containing protein